LATRLLARSWRVEFFEDTIRDPAGNTAAYARLKVPDFAAAVAVRERDGKIPLVKQYRHGARREFWELPAGFIERKETPLACIKREFSEEVGFKLTNPKLIVRLYPSPARSPQRAYIFLGKIGRRTKRKPDSTETLTVDFFSKKQAFKLLSERIASTHLLAFLLCVAGDSRKDLLLM
jgi:ADP-ribose pyrophosphatase